jgi:hypothetical protein
VARTERGSETERANQITQSSATSDLIRSARNKHLAVIPRKAHHQALFVHGQPPLFPVGFEADANPTVAALTMQRDPGRSNRGSCQDLRLLVLCDGAVNIELG